ncbi:MAG TPA: acylphosphatase [Candidatus Paceibacterota bacterium]|nr:acylphosphatase [Candidatus Paceibacterota bacterium]
MGDIKHVKIIVSGRVQGVAYRYYSRAAAIESGIAGFAVNKPDGTVYLEAEGKPAAVEKFIEWCRNGPPGARVDNIKVAEGEPQHFKAFSIED